MRTGWVLVLIVGCSGGSPNPTPKSSTGQLQDVLRGWDIHLCSFSPRELLLAENWAHPQSTLSSEREIENRAERKRRAALEFAKARGRTLGEYLAAVGADERAFLEVLRREAEVEAIAASRLRRPGQAPPTDAEIHLFLIQESAR